MNGDVILFAGTTEGRMLAEACRNMPLTLHVCVATDYGETLIEPAGNVRVLAGRKDAAAIEALIAETGARLVVADIPSIPIEAAKRCGIPAVAMGNFSWDWIYADFAARDFTLQPSSGWSVISRRSATSSWW